MLSIVKGPPPVAVVDGVVVPGIAVEPLTHSKGTEFALKAVSAEGASVLRKQHLSLISLPRAVYAVSLKHDSGFAAPAWIRDISAARPAHKTHFLVQAWLLFDYNFPGVLNRAAEFAAVVGRIPTLRIAGFDLSAEGELDFRANFTQPFDSLDAAIQHLTEVIGEQVEVFTAPNLDTAVSSLLMSGHVFISYVRDNKDLVTRLASDLRRYGVEVWLDRERITPGQRWRDAIRVAISSGGLFLACFSREYAEREHSYMNEELTVAIDELRQRPTDRTWFVPVLLSQGYVPDRAIGAGETLRDLQWIDLDNDWNSGVASIVRVARREKPVLARLAKDSVPAAVKQEDEAFIVKTLGAGNIGPTSAHLYGTASSQATRLWFDFDTSPRLEFSIAALDGLGMAHTLQPSTVYYFRYVGQNSKGQTVRGEVRTFRTLE
jgi:TIR domain